MEEEEGRAAIWEIDAQTERSACSPPACATPTAWAGSRRPACCGPLSTSATNSATTSCPDYITSVKDGAFYGWPWSYFGETVDTRVKPENPQMAAKAIAPDYAVGAHTASLGLAFAEGAKLGAKFSEGAFVGQHGSWNRDPYSGYKVIFVPFVGGKPAGEAQDVLTGFIDAEEEKAYGRPVGVAIGKDGALLVADDVGNADLARDVVGGADQRGGEVSAGAFLPSNAEHSGEVDRGEAARRWGQPQMLLSFTV